jgi:hypothetical protein
MQLGSRRIGRRTLIGGAVGATIAGSAIAQNGPTTMNPQDILFSTPTIANDMAPLEETDLPTADDVVFHEDDWRQVEFFPRARASEMQEKLTELKAFEAANRAQSGWRRVYVRTLVDTPVISGPLAIDRLARTLGAPVGGAPLLFQSPNILVGRISNGFSVPVGDGVSLYGFSNASGIAVLGADLRPGSDHGRLSDVFRTLSRSDDLVLVDWRSQMMLLSLTSDGQLLIWEPS